MSFSYDSGEFVEATANILTVDDLEMQNEHVNNIAADFPPSNLDSSAHNGGVDN